MNARKKIIKGLFWSSMAGVTISQVVAVCNTCSFPTRVSSSNYNWACSSCARVPNSCSLLKYANNQQCDYAQDNSTSLKNYYGYSQHHIRDCRYNGSVLDSSLTTTHKSVNGNYVFSTGLGDVDFYTGTCQNGYCISVAPPVFANLDSYGWDVYVNITCPM